MTAKLCPHRCDHHGLGVRRTGHDRKSRRVRPASYLGTNGPVGRRPGQGSPLGSKVGKDPMCLAEANVIVVGTMRFTDEPTHLWEIPEPSPAEIPVLSHDPAVSEPQPVTA